MPLREHFEVRIPSDTTAGQQLQDQIIEHLEQLQYSDRDIFGVRLALEEALVNAIKHGNGMDPNKFVTVRWDVDAVSLHVEIADEGPGFDLQEVPDPTADENLNRPCGRGIMLMRAFMTRVEYNSTGNKIVLEKTRSLAE